MVTDFVSFIYNLKTTYLQPQNSILSSLRQFHLQPQNSVLKQPVASCLVYSLVFIEYNTLLEVGLNFLISLFTFTFDILYPIVKVGHTDDYSHGAVKLSVSLVDKDAMKKYL
ncbi:hypothetical protein PNI0159_00316 [Streptococcus pneumoniae PNI0159]|nr:hypothetical protein PNI0159_00316 [Streptococcus pneumoniae PNI0159]